MVFETLFQRLLTTHLHEHAVVGDVCFGVFPEPFYEQRGLWLPPPYLLLIMAYLVHVFKGVDFVPVETVDTDVALERRIVFFEGAHNAWHSAHYFAEHL